ncbi:UNVERIFIED_CONTAM: hypothetical protein Slati_2712200 [Sesamum latifolium]|uniref:Uncharacterized protein n=1 Tax=Sesamum latifolium TaxID=2727402 RepID=A0AAW2VVP4_9LAMI
MRELDKLHSAEEIRWKQRSKAAWLAEGNRNTAFFHAKASPRRRVNHIDRIRNEMGSWCHEEEEVQGVIQRYFHSIFSSEHPINDELEKAIEAVPSRVTEDMNQLLLEHYTVEEGKSALTQIIYLDGYKL